VIARRLPLYAFALWIALSVCYALPQLYARALNTRRPQPISPEGYFEFFAHMLTGRLDQGVPGIAFSLWNALPFSLFLVGVGTVLAFLLGTALGALAGWWRGGFDGSVTTATAVLWATPAFVLAGLGVYYLALELGWFPPQQAYELYLSPEWSWAFVTSVMRHAQLPIIVLLVASTGFWTLNMRNVMTSVVHEEYIALARAKGLREGRILVHYAGRNALLPVLTGFAVAFGLAIGGLPALEAVFSYPGAGWGMQQSAMAGNFPLLQGLFVAIVFAVIAVNLAVDVLQVLLDPRLRTR
jgi:peptide/nickel transport system permease protein